MTIRQLAETAGCDITTVKRIGKTIFPDVKSIGRGVALDYTLEQSKKIMEKLPKKNYVSDPNMGQIPQVNIGQMPQVDYEIIGKMIGMAVSAAMAPVVKQLENINRPALISPVEDYFTLTAYCSIHNIPTSISELRKIGMECRIMTLESGKELRKVQDERWAYVNSYPVEILDEYFTV